MIGDFYMNRFSRCMILINICILFFINVAFADGTTYNVEELGMDITLPAKYSVIMRNTDENAKIFDNLGTTKAEINKYFEENNIYLNAISDVDNKEIVVTMTPIASSVFSFLDDSTLKQFESYMSETYSNMGLNITNCEIYQSSNSKYVKLLFSDKSGSINGLQYYTVRDKIAINITMRSYDGTISSAKADEMKGIIDNIKYNAKLLVTEQDEDDEDDDLLIYTDEDTGLTFSIPNGWHEEKLSKPREHIDAKFVLDENDGTAIIYGSSDLWESMSDIEKAGYTRATIGKKITKSYIEEMCNVASDKISMVNYNGVEYYKFETKTFVEQYGINFELTMINLMHVDNGWIYSFQFGGDSESKSYADFERLVSSVEYPNQLSDNVLSSNNEESSKLIIMLLLLSAGILCFALFAHKKSKVTEMTDDNDVNDSALLTVTCKNCGKEVPTNSKFCHYCGTGMDKENLDS